MSQVFVLVHGAFHGGWCWREVSQALVSRGHRVYAPTLTGLADRSHLAQWPITLSTHIADIVNLIRWERLSDVVLCGHSYGTLVIDGAVEELAARSIRSLVYLDGTLPEDGVSVADSAQAQGLAAAFAPLPGTNLVPPPPAAAFGLSEQDALWVDPLLTPQPAGTFTEKPRVTGAREAVARKAYILATAFAGLPQRHLCAAQARRLPGWTVHEIPCGHDVMIEQPQALAALLEQIA